MTADLRPPARERATRFELLVVELRVALHRADPQLSEAAVLEEAVHHAARRLAGGDLVSSFVGQGVDAPIGQPRAEEFAQLVEQLLPKVRALLPHLSDVEALRAAALMAEYRIAEEDTLVWGNRFGRPG